MSVPPNDDTEGALAVRDVERCRAIVHRHAVANQVDALIPKRW